jgi:hypothetical protein
MQEARAKQLGYSHMIVLISFLLNHHHKINSFISLAEATQKEIDDTGTDIYWINRRYNEFQNNEELPALDSFSASSLFEQLLMLLLAIIVGPAFTVMDITEERRSRVQRLKHTEERRNWFSKYVITISSCVFALILALLFIVPRSRFWGFSISILISLSIMTMLVGLSALVWWQIAWKEFWQDRLLEVIARAGKKGDHDLFNRAMILKNYVESQPDIPIPGNLGFYAVIYSGVQGIVLLAFSVLHPM